MAVLAVRMKLPPQPFDVEGFFEGYRVDHLARAIGSRQEVVGPRTRCVPVDPRRELASMKFRFTTCGTQPLRFSFPLAYTRRLFRSASATAPSFLHLMSTAMFWAVFSGMLLTESMKF